MSVSMIDTMRLQEQFGGLAKCRVAGDFDPSDWPDHSIDEQSESSVCSADIAKEHGFSGRGHRLP
jgi:hypothetical protein